MELSAKQQVFELIKKSKEILLVTREGASGDALGSMTALFLALEKMQKKVIMVNPSFVDEKHIFLPATSQIKKDIHEARDFIISINTTRTKASKLSYKQTEKSLDIFITPEENSFEKKDVQTSLGKFRFDLIIILDAPDLESMGKLFERNAALFYEIPIINIDHHAANEYFGQVNLVNITFSSTSEVVLNLLESLGDDLIDENIATCLLCGIIEATQSFQVSTTPKTLTAAATLISLGADQQKIIKNLYKRKKLETLKLWGRLLARAKEDKQNNFIWSLLTLEDFAKSKASKEDLFEALAEFYSNMPKKNLAFVIAETHPKNISVVMLPSNKIKTDEFQQYLKGQWKKNYLLIDFPNESLLKIEKEILQKLQKFFSA